MSDVAGPVAGLLLAAGLSRRFGAPKLLATAPALGGRPVVRAAAEVLAASLAAGVLERIVVVAADVDSLGAALAGLPLSVVANPRAAEGMSTSLRAGLAALRTASPALAAVVIALGDQPTVDPDVVRRLIERMRATGAAVVVPRYAGTRGHPVLFTRSVFDELAAVTGDRGGRDVVERDPARVAYVDLSVPPPPDVDTVEDLTSL